ncbi:MAG: cytochrome C biogenesis protein [Candidatus Diapherotrites archaeon]|nr:cytochrome C biogenesis protein [Candidatus Diapherotrites archaeon]
MTEVTLGIAFLAGLVSFLSPCVLPLIPAYLTFLAGTTLKDAQENAPGTRWRIFLSSVCFVIGFSTIFSAIGVLLQSTLSFMAYDLRVWLGYLGGTIIILFGLMLLGIIQIDALQVERRIKVPKTRYAYLTSFLFGAAFAVGWTPCVGAVLGGVLTLAVTLPHAAFPLLLSYSLGLGVPFLLVGLFTAKSTRFISVLSPHLKWLNRVFGAILVILGILVFTGTLNLVANFLPVSNILGR